jgi:Na+/melibiose symporter-like transporter
MSSCLAPWVLLWLANLFGVLRFKQEPKGWQRTLFACAALGSLLLIVLSRSGHSMFVLAGAVLLFLAWLKNSSATARTYFVLLLVAGVVLPALTWLTVNAMQERVVDASMGNDSWDDRAASMLLGFRLLVADGGVSLLLGLGSGQTADLLWNLTGLDAVWSVLLTYIYETGLVGAMVVSWIGWHLFAIWRASRAKLVFAIIVGVWLVGITITTSYQQLLPLWIALGWLTVWPEVCEVPGGSVRSEPEERVGRFIPVRAFPRRDPLAIATSSVPASTSTGAPA